MKKKVILVTGASSGIGSSAVQLLLKDGHAVYAAARRIERMKNLEQEGARLLNLDVTSDDSCKQAVATILSESGQIDVLVNNAGYALYGSVEEVSIKDARQQFEVNLFGLANLTQKILPYMRERAQGRIINISSIGGKIYTPLGAWYHATKHALEGFSDALRLETKPFGIDVVIIEPGAIESEWATIAGESLMRTSGNGAYKHMAKAYFNYMKDVYDNGKASSPMVIGKIIKKVSAVRKPKTRYVAGKSSGFALISRKLLSDRAFDWAMSWQMKLDSK